MKLVAVFGMIAMVPAAFNAVPASAAGLWVPICTGDGLVHMVQVPTQGGPAAPAGEQGGCCVKGCHASGSRKRAAKNFEPSQ